MPAGSEAYAKIVSPHPVPLGFMEAFPQRKHTTCRESCNNLCDSVGHNAVTLMFSHILNGVNGAEQV